MGLKDYTQLQADVDTTWGTKPHVKQPALDSLESQMRVTAAMNLQVPPIVVPLTTTPATLDVFDNVVFAENITADDGTGLFSTNFGGTGFYLVAFNMSVTSNANMTLLIGLKTTSAAFQPIEFPLKNNEELGISATTIIPVTEGQSFGVAVASQSGSPTITVDTAVISTFRVG